MLDLKKGRTQIEYLKLVREILGEYANEPKYTDEYLLSVPEEFISDLYLKAIYDGQIEGEVPVGEEKPWVRNFPKERNNLILNDDTMYKTYIRESKSRLDKVAIVEMDGTTYTHRQLHEKIHAMAKGLLKKGIKEGSKVAVLTTNSVEQATTVMAVNAIGATSKMVNYWDEPEAIGNSISEIDAEMIIIDEELIKNGLDISSINHKNVPIVVVRGKQKYAEVGVNSYDQLIEDGKDQELIIAEKDSKRPALIITSSGSTGKPKQIVHTDATINAAIQGFIHSDWSLGEEAAMLQSVPGFIGSLGTISSLYFSLVTGSPLVGVQGTRIEEMANNTSTIIMNFKDLKEKSKLPKELGLVVFTAPDFMRQLGERYDEIEELSYVEGILTTGSKFPAEEVDTLVNLLSTKGLKCGICNVYGQNEMGGLITVTTPKHNENGSIGYPAIGRTIIIVNPETFEIQNQDQEGLILEHSPSFTSGYYGKPEKTKEICVYYKDGEISLDNNGGVLFFITGDLGRMKVNGFGNITDRMSRVLNRGDCKFSLSAIEEEIRTRVLGVKECAMVSLGDRSDTNHDGIAFVTLTNETLAVFDNSLEAYTDFINDELSKGKLKINSKTSPNAIIAIPQIPMMQTGKRNYKLLEQQAKEIRDNPSQAQQYIKTMYTANGISS